MKYLTAILVLINAMACHANVSQSEARVIFNKLNKVSKAKAPPLKFIDCGTINAYTTKNEIYMCNETLEFGTKAEVAMVLGHELGHFKFQDVTYPANSKSQEYRADHWGSLWTQQIGYNKCETAKLFLHFYEMWGNGGGWFASHPANLKRYKAVSKGCQ